MKVLVAHFLFLFIPSFLVAQSKGKISDYLNYKITYQLSYQPDSTNVESRKSESMLLYIGDNISKFSSAGTAIGDSLMNTINRNNKSSAEFARIRSLIPHTDIEHVIYKGIPKNKITVTQNIATDELKYTLNKNLFNWKIHPETKQVAGYKAQKATTEFAGRNYTAWFTSEIPIPDGPYKFNGLPGLIVKIADNKDHYVFELIQFINLKTPIPFKFDENDYIHTKQAKFLELKKQYKLDPISALERAGIKIEFKEGVREKMHQEHLEQIKKENNPIELE